MRLILLLSLFVFTTFAQNISIDDKALQKVSLQLHWKYQFEFAGFIAAKEKGFYRDAGLDVELKEYKAGVDIVKDVLTHKSNYGVYNSNILLEYLKKKSIKLLSSYFKRSALVLITKKRIKTPKDLVGKTIMAAGIQDFKLNFQPMFEKFDINISDVHFVQHTYNVQDFKKVDAMTAFISDQPYKLDKLGIKYNIINPSDFGLFNLQLELFTSNDEIKNHFNRTKAFRDASLKGWDYALTHKEEIVHLIHDKYAPKLSLDSLRDEAKEIERLILPKTYNLGSIDKNFLDRQLEMFKFYNKISQEIGLDDFLYDDLEKKSVKLNTKERQYLSNHQSINVCSASNMLPFTEFVENKPVGIMSDIFKIMHKKLGVTFVVKKFTTYEEVQKNIERNKCQLVSNVMSDDIVYQGIIPSIAFYKTNFALVSSIDKSFVTDIRSLQEKHLMVNSLRYKNKLLRLYPYLKISVEENSEKMVQEVIKGNAYGIVTLNETADYLIDKYGYGKLKIDAFLPQDKSVPLSIGINIQEKYLASIINQTLASISESKIDAIMKKWRITRYNERIDYTLVYAILFVVVIILSIMGYYQKKLKRFNITLEQEVEKKTLELRKLNESLELTVEEKIAELIKKDKILTIQSKQAVMGEMISMIAHQWRQPLATITLQISNLQVNRMLGNDVSDESIDTTLEKISNSIIYLSDTIDDFQTYFRPDRVATEINVEDFIDKVISLAEARIKTSSVKVETSFEYRGNMKIYMNELIQVMLNILNNAIDAFLDVKREHPLVTLRCREEGDTICISIEDNASGIKEENLKKLFDPYFSTKGKNGTGLGLYMSQMIIQKQFNGEINVTSSSEGTTFRVVIPRNLN